MAVRILLLDGAGFIHARLGDLIDAEGELLLVGEATTTAEALAMVVGRQPQVVVVNGELTEGTGATACRAIRVEHPTVACWVLTALFDGSLLVDSVMAGASGFSVNPLVSPEFLTGIRLMARGGSVVEPSLVEGVCAHLRGPRRDRPRHATLDPQAS